MIAKLDAMDFDWGKGANKSFDERVEELKQFKSKYGNKAAIYLQNPSLALFCYAVRSARRNPENSDTKITTERIAALDRIGFEWKMEKEQTSSQTGSQEKARPKNHLMRG